MNDTRDQEPFHFEGEEANAGYASPVLDLIAAAVLVALCITVMIASLRLPVPGDIHTAPGLLPFLTAASLMLMALGLGASALARHRAGVRMPALAGRDLGADLRSLALAGVCAIYIGGLQILAFRHDLVVGGFRHSFSAFEPLTVLVLSTIIGLNWRGPLWVTVTISAGWTLTLSAVFQHVFKIPLPGTF